MALQTFSFFSCSLHAIDSRMVEPLSEIIVTKNGFAWIYFWTSREMSQENPLCWKAIQLFRTKTSYNKMKDVYTKFFAPNAPLSVNISDRSKRILVQRIERITESTPLEQLQTIYDAVQLEVLDLMSTDSYHRFVNSIYYQKYKQNDPPPNPNAKEEDSSEGSQSRHSAAVTEQGTELGLISNKKSTVLDNKSTNTNTTTANALESTSISSSSPTKPLLVDSAFDSPSLGPVRSLGTIEEMQLQKSLSFQEFARQQDDEHVQPHNFSLQENSLPLKKDTHEEEFDVQ